MMLSKIAKMVLMLGIAFCAMAAVMAQAVATRVPLKILFVGDSFTYYQDGIYAHFEDNTVPVSRSQDENHSMPVWWKSRLPVLWLRCDPWPWPQSRGTNWEASFP